MKKIFVLVIAILALVVIKPTDSQALILTSGLSESGLGSYTGSFDYSYVNSTTGQIVISLTNTTPLANGGFITALAFNNPGDLISGVSLISTDLDFGLIGAPFTTNGVGAGPFGNFDIGSSTGGGFQGGGPNPGALGIGIGQSATFTFALTGINLDTLTSETFFSAAGLSAPPADGQGVQNFVVRYRAFVNDGSDKVVGVPSGAVPEPASMLLFGTGLAGAALRRKFQS